MKRAFFLVFAGLFLSSACGFAAPSAPSDDEKEGVISGTPIKRTAGDGWLGIEVKGGTFHLTFYNAKKKPIPADKTSAVLRWAVHYQPNEERTELLPTDVPAVLASEYPVRPPLSFLLHITLLGTGDNNNPESYVIDFSG